MTQQVFLRISDIIMQNCNTICAMKVKADVKRQTTKHFKINNKLLYRRTLHVRQRKALERLEKIKERSWRPMLGLIMAFRV